MNEKFKKKREEVLQTVADFLCIMLELTMDKEDHFSFWMWKALSLDYWCLENGIELK